jgi:FtsH-binding integral membrane protein
MIRRRGPNYVVLSGSAVLIMASVLHLFGHGLIAAVLVLLGAGLTLAGVLRQASKQHRALLLVLMGAGLVAGLLVAIVLWQTG